MSGRGGTRVGAGRPKGRASPQVLEQKAIFEEAARSHALKALGVLVEIADKGGDERSRVAACKLIFDRGFGAAIQRIEEGLPPGDFSDLSDEEVNERAEEIARRVIAASRGAKTAKGGGKPRGKPD